MYCNSGDETSIKSNIRQLHSRAKVAQMCRSGWMCSSCGLYIQSELQSYRVELRILRVIVRELSDAYKLTCEMVLVPL